MKTEISRTPIPLVRRARLRVEVRACAAVRTASNSKKKPATTSSPGHDARRWREGATAPRDAEIRTKIIFEPLVDGAPVLL